MTITLVLAPSIITIRPYSVINPSVGIVTATVNGYAIGGGQYPHTVYLETGPFSPGFLGNVQIGSTAIFPGIYPTYLVEITITADSNCPIGTYSIPIFARPFMPSEEYAADQAVASITVTVTAGVTYILDIVAKTGGTTSPVPGRYTVAETDEIPVVAIPSGNNVFDHWEVDGTRVEGSGILLSGFTHNTILTAFFVIQYQVTIQSPIGGTVSPDPATSPFTIVAGSPVHLIATADSTHYFDYWVFNGVRNGQISDYFYNVLADVSIQAVFTVLQPGQYSLTITTSGNGSTVPTAGTYIYNDGTNVHITAKPGSGATFLEWIVDGSSGGAVPDIYMVMDRKHDVKATFTGEPRPNNDWMIAVVIVGAAIGVTAIMLYATKKR